MKIIRLLSAACLLFTIAVSLPAEGARNRLQHESLSSYIARLQPPQSKPQHASVGSLWVDSGSLADLSRDFKAYRAGDLVQVLLVQDTSAENSGSVGSDRSFKADSGIDALPAQLKTSKVQNLFSPHSSATLSGKSSASTTLKLRTTLSGRVAAVLENGLLVIEAERTTDMNNERQTIILRGVARPGDLAADNSLPSTALSNLEIELKGKGVISDGTRPPNAVVRLLLRILNF